MRRIVTLFAAAAIAAGLASVAVAGTSGGPGHPPIGCPPANGNAAPPPCHPFH